MCIHVSLYICKQGDKVTPVKLLGGRDNRPLARAGSIMRFAIEIKLPFLTHQFLIA